MAREWNVPDRTEARGLIDWWYGRDDPVLALKVAGAVKDHEIAQLKLKVATLKVEIASQKETIAQLQLQLSKDPEVIKARREKKDKEIQDRIDVRLKEQRAEREKELKERDEREEKNPSLKTAREEREREDRDWAKSESEKYGITYHHNYPLFYGGK
jgi:hypothetical protein